ncbi:Homeodomain-like [Acididesulfobacillus acetoxydans]|uniref:Homeodomain-like n=1 Tax=Acididesulfobacillus acetoxydans TaxID=1561005 RepID=A0A8S0WMH2_9FIRM|nr:PucR family transcriptional regulator [Acididesulfobacillus acetoxydans]CAA7600574.1 Homeodomain-like [Acididesulfobacillus acetoxydans]CEJ06708.1 Purine catabolism regulator-like protein [Acididesulfobacillus acetoxydans]
MNKEQLLTIADALKRPLFQHAEVIAGSRGLTRPIRWVHVLESTENASFLNGGELLLSTGVGFGESAAKRLSYLNEVIQRQAVGLCLELGLYIREIPRDMRELSDHHEFPLIVFHQPVRFVDITLDLHENLVNCQTQVLKSLERYARDLQRLTLQTQSLPRILGHFQAMVQAQTFFLNLQGPPLFSPNMPQSVQAELTGWLQAFLLSLDPLPESSGFLPIAAHKYFLYQPVIAMGQVLAYLGLVLYENQPDEMLHLILDYTAIAMAQILLRRMFAQERSLDNENRLLEDILQNRPGTEEQFRAILGLHATSSHRPRYWAAILEALSDEDELHWTHETDSPFHDQLAIFRFLLTRHSFRSLLRSRGHRLYFLLVETNSVPARRLSPHENARLPLEKALNDMVEAARRALGADVRLHLGVSNASLNYAHADQAFKEAEQVLAFTAEFRSPFFEDLGVYRLLLQAGREALESFIADYLGPILSYDAKSGSQLLLTLRVLLDENLSKQEAAGKLFIRRQTLYHRLEKIEQLLGSHYLKPENRLSLELALRAHAWLHRQDNETEKTGR